MPTSNGFRSSILRYLCPTKSSSFKNFWWGHCMWFVIWAPNKKFWLRLWIGNCLKNFFEDLFCLFFLVGEHLRLCPWSLASKNLALGLERVCSRKSCPWPWIFFVSLALSLVYSTPPQFATETTNVVWKLSQCEILIPRCRLSKKTKQKQLRHN